MQLNQVKPSTPVVSPAQWCGEVGCAIGPFSSRDTALSFATYVISVGDYGVRSGEIFALRDEWFVEVLEY